jgi:hypothetical protein
MGLYVLGSGWFVLHGFSVQSGEIFRGALRIVCVYAGRGLVVLFPDLKDFLFDWTIILA